MNDSERNMIAYLDDHVAALVFATTFLIAFLIYRRRRISDRKYPPSLPWLPVVGSLPFIGKADGWPKLFMEKSAVLGSVFGFRTGPGYVFVDYYMIVNINKYIYIYIYIS